MGQLEKANAARVTRGGSLWTRENMMSTSLLYSCQAKRFYPVKSICNDARQPAACRHDNCTVYLPKMLMTNDESDAPRRLVVPIIKAPTTLQPVCIPYNYILYPR
ncbi:hypothetical protein SODALDRAFT_78561 [Sodiomyces alkalinus F11]|uniref:Uncharacterized protein n=1 Tax=Sodiomyces alkalinus (strain CBS 110278 / VKM F-3762 / F11) TaxID=1314773 RepID=A0A3N2PKU6_SODAK|nr:hypothetical protein SODALDRAFT_78561 [Sodiomyces alkalinus F11]ROT35153.1 hypothetical protein SODALDRAFT_78561 [Sodiomyces alkalinus F11]